MSAAKKTDQDEQNLIKITKTIVIDAPPDIVFKDISDPAELTNWFPDHAILEPRIGGKVRFSFYKEKSAAEHQRDFLQEGTIKEFIPDKKLSYTWQFKDTKEFPETIVIWELEEINHNKTRVVLTHSGFTGRETGELSSKEFDNGWTYFLERLEKYCRTNK
ncbi:MAG TPA: SRPBCC domain-containing protein [Nitrososphaeraceae archaeon]|jgi:uncharacterized protein YndB with AHSA1/START domain